MAPRGIDCLPLPSPGSVRTESESHRGSIGAKSTRQDMTAVRGAPKNDPSDSATTAQVLLTAQVLTAQADAKPHLE